MNYAERCDQIIKHARQVIAGYEAIKAMQIEDNGKSAAILDKSIANAKQIIEVQENRKEFYLRKEKQGAD